MVINSYVIEILYFFFSFFYKVENVMTVILIPFDYFALLRLISFYSLFAFVQFNLIVLLWFCLFHLSYHKIKNQWNNANKFYIGWIVDCKSISSKCSYSIVSTVWLVYFFCFEKKMNAKFIHTKLHSTHIQTTLTITTHVHSIHAKIHLPSKHFAL